MIHYILLLLIPCLSCIQSIAQKQYMLKSRYPNVIMFSAVTSFIAFCMFLISSRFRILYTPALLSYALCFAVPYAAGWVSTVLALKYGPIALTSLIIACSLIFPTVYGIILGDVLTPVKISGIVLVLLSIVLVNLKRDRKSRFSWKWFACAMTAFVSNGACTISQNMQKRALGDEYGQSFMVISLGLASVALFVYALVVCKNFNLEFRGCIAYSAVNGAANAGIHFILLAIIGNIPTIVLYPTNSALGMLAAFLLAYFGYHERFSRIQYAGYALGVLSIVLLNL